MKKYKLVIPDSVNKDEIEEAALWFEEDGKICKKTGEFYYFANSCNIEVGSHAEQWLVEIEENSPAEKWCVGYWEERKPGPWDLADAFAAHIAGQAHATKTERARFNNLLKCCNKFRTDYELMIKTDTACVNTTEIYNLMWPELEKINKKN